MSAKISNTATGAVQAIIESSEERDMSKYTLKGVNFEAAANGVIAKLRFEMKPEEQDKLRKKSRGITSTTTRAALRRRWCSRDSTPPKSAIC
jgi:hypothetical protein